MRLLPRRSVSLDEKIRNIQSPRRRQGRTRTRESGGRGYEAIPTVSIIVVVIADAGQGREAGRLQPLCRLVGVRLFAVRAANWKGSFRQASCT